VLLLMYLGLGLCLGRGNESDEMGKGKTDGSRSARVPFPWTAKKGGGWTDLHLRRGTCVLRL
jgi:hypothetical protein